MDKYLSHYCSPALSFCLTIYVQCSCFSLQTTDTQRELFFFLKSQIFGLGQTIWADKFWGIFGQFISTYFGTLIPLSMFSINQPLFLQKTKPLHPHTKYLFGDLDLNLGREKLGIQPSCVRSPCVQVCNVSIFPTSTC